VFDASAVSRFFSIRLAKVKRFFFFWQPLPTTLDIPTGSLFSPESALGPSMMGSDETSGTIFGSFLLPWQQQN